jgi:DNA polymerase III epsilon subunit-like protein
MNIMVLDTETTGLKPETDKVIEIAAAVLQVEQREILWVYSTLVPTVKTNPIPEINHISDALLAYAQPLRNSQLLKPLEFQATQLGINAFVAHNANFDKMFCETLRMDLWKTFPWVCSQNDIVYPQQSGKSRRLVHLAADHGILFGAQRHRALADVLLLVDLLCCVGDLKEQIETALKPNILLHAQVSYQRRGLAEKAGFRWNGTCKRWEKKVPEDTDLTQWPFKVMKIRDA